MKNLGSFSISFSFFHHGKIQFLKIHTVLCQFYRTVFLQILFKLFEDRAQFPPKGLLCDYIPWILNVTMHPFS